LDQSLSDIQRLAVIIKPLDSSTFSVDVIAGLPNDEATLGVQYYETTLSVAKSALEGEIGIDALFEAAKQTLKELIDGKVHLTAQ
jgi:hypothetical protein